ncbi:hypothetical protein Tco_1036254 [Tanacetum coccineum]
MDILQNTNFFRAFTASASVRAIYIQQFWNTLTYEAKLELTIFREIHFGIITHMNVDYAELMWEEFVQAIQTFLADKANLGSPAKKCKKTKPLVISYCRFTKLILCYLGGIHCIHQRSGSLFHLAEEDLRLGNLKFVPKGEDDEVFRMKIPKELITDDIRKASYYNAYLEMVAKHDHKNVRKGKVLKKVQKGKSPLKLVNKDKEVQHEPEPQDEGEDDDFYHAIRMSLDSFQAQSQAPVSEVAIREPIPETTRKLPEVEGKDPGKSHVVPARPNPEPMHEDFMAIIYPKVHESLKLPADEHVILEDLLSSSGTLSLMKNLDDIYTFGDLFFDDKSTEDEPGKPNVDAKVVSMVIVPIYQANTSSPPLSTPVIEISSPKSSSPPFHAPIVKAITVTTSINHALLPPPPTQILMDPELATRVSVLEKRNAELEHVFTIHNKTTKNLASRIFTLEHRDLEYKIDNYVHETVKENTRLEHAKLYEALDRSIARDNMDKFLAEKAKSQKRRHDDNNPP